MSYSIKNGLRLSDRREFLRTAGVAVPGLILNTPLIATSACVETEDNIEGPFYKPGSPERANLIEDGMPGVRLTIAGRVLGTSCDPLANALLDVWQADDSGQYDNLGFRLRGRLYTSKTGTYRIETIVPKRYRINGIQKYRPAHIHLKVSAQGFPLLTTQLYFAGDPYNQVDPAFRESLVIRPTGDREKQRAHFDFILKPA